jgi:hypothetical protein
MGRRLKPVLLILALALVGCALPGSPAPRAADLCAALHIPDALDLDCAADPEGPAGAVEVRPADTSGFGALSRLGLRPLDPATDGLAWTDPDLWLKQRLQLDTSGVAEAIRGMAGDADNPLSGGVLEQAAQALVAGIDKLGRLPLSACEPLKVAGDRRELDCTYGATPVALYLDLRLVAAGERRWAMTYWTLSERRLRHFDALANGFTPPPA